MDHNQFFQACFESQGFDVVLMPNVFDPPYDPVRGWPLKTPKIQWKDNTILVANFQDFVTHTGDQVIELEVFEQAYWHQADRVVVLHWPVHLKDHYRGRMNLVEFSTHNYMLMRTLAAQESKWWHIHTQPKTRAWQCLNGRTCEHRRWVAEILQHWPNGYLSLGSEIPLHVWDYPTYRGTDNDENFYRLADVYGSCAVNIVTETQYDGCCGIITEKTLLAMLANQIPIVIGYRGIVQHLRDRGFDTFDDLLDTSYDDLPDDIRYREALVRNRQVILGEVDLTPYRDRLNQQREHALRGLSSWYRSNLRERSYEIAQRLRPR